jgi:hypothetical protein
MSSTTSKSRQRVAWGAAALVAGVAWSGHRLPSRLAGPGAEPGLRGEAGESVARGSVNVRALAMEVRGEERAPTAAEPEQEIDRAESLRALHRLPLPNGARVLLEKPEPRKHFALPEETRPASPPPLWSFAALADDGQFGTPDTNGAVGPAHVVTMLNSQFRVQDRSGNVLATLATFAFWSSVSRGDPLSDPNVVYDPFADRWIADIITGTRVVDSAILLGVTQTGDPAGAWTLYRVDVDPADLSFPDFPRLGFNKDWIAIEATMHRSSDRIFVRSDVFTFDKANLYAGGATARHTLFHLTGAGTTQVPAVTCDATTPVLFLLQEYGGDQNGDGLLRLWSIGGPVGSETLTSIAFSRTTDTWSFAPPGGADFAPQIGGPAKIQLDTADFTSVVYRDGLITAAHSIFLPAVGGATRSALQWWQIATDGTIVQRGRIDDPEGGAFYGYPTVAANRNNDLLMGYSVFSTGGFGAAAYAYRAAGDPPGTMRKGEVLKSGEGYYVQLTRGLNRWGDYSSTLVDPVNDTDFWTLQEYAAGVDSRTGWGTWWGLVRPDSALESPLPPRNAPHRIPARRIPAPIRPR